MSERPYFCSSETRKFISAIVFVCSSGKLVPVTFISHKEKKEELGSVVFSTQINMSQSTIFLGKIENYKKEKNKNNIIPCNKFYGGMVGVQNWV